MALHAADYRGQVKFGGLPLPGATVIVNPGEKQVATITDMEGNYAFSNLPDGTQPVRVEMLCFAPQQGDTSTKDWELKVLPFADLKASIAAPALKPQPKPEQKQEAPPPPPPEAADGFLINGTNNNGASTPFALPPAFGNNRKGPGSLYNGSIGFTADNSALDARAFSLTGQDTAKPAYSRTTGLLSFGGPLKIPRLLPSGPNIVVNYQWTRNRNATTQPGLMPTLADRNAASSPQARALLALFPLPNFSGSSRYNYQAALAGSTHQDSLQLRADKTLNRKEQVSGNFAFQSTRSDTTNLFGFLDTTDSLGLNSTIRWRHSFNTRFYGTLSYQFSRQAIRVNPFFANRANVSGQAGIAGNDQEPRYWGPPTLSFNNGVSTLSDAAESFTRNQTSAVSYTLLWSRNRHNVTFGTDARRQQFNLLGQQDARGSFTFPNLAAFLAGVPDTASVSFGNADKYLRSWFNDGYFMDDWRISPGLTLNSGMRWEYSSPVSENYGRLVNLNTGPGFTMATPVLGNHLIQPDRHALQPRIAISWRPHSASSMVIRGGYGVYYNTSVYQAIATQMAQQAPLAKSVSVQNTATRPLTLADAFNASAATTPDTFAVDPHFLTGYTHTWQVSVQRDLPGALVLTGTYLGIKGTRGVQTFLPNTYPAGAANPCPACPTGYAYLASNGNSTQESGQVQLRRRLHNGLTATVQYTFAKAIDDAALGGRGQGAAVIAQDWLNLRGERGLSNFDQRHLLSVQTQYTTGMGVRGGTLVNGWRGTLFKEWTVATQISKGSGLPLNPVYPGPVNGTGVTGSIRPDYTGAPLYRAPSGLFLNPAAFAAPAPGHWGDAGRNSITGPGQFNLSASMGRTFRLADRVSVDLRIDAANALNHVTYPSWVTTVGSAQFGLPLSANPMRSVQTTLRARF
jgi:hypothetical protein